MGVGLAGAIGVALARKKEKTYLFEGDGGFVQNFQEIGTAIHNKLNLKIFASFIKFLFRHSKFLTENSSSG